MAGAKNAKRRVRMVDVGELADVSAQTVSRYFTGSGYVNEETRARIQKAVEQLGYRRNRLARNLHLPGSDTIGVLTSGALNYGASEALTGLFAAAHEADIALIVAHVASDEDDSRDGVRQSLERMLSLRVDGVVVLARGHFVDDVPEILADDVPYVVVGGRAVRDAGLAAADSYEAGLIAGRHLVGLGHRRVAFVSGPDDADESRERERGYLEAISEAGLTPGPRIVGGDWTSSAGYRAAAATDLGAASAYLAANDELALGFMAAARERGATAPEDFSIVGIDDMPEAPYFAPALTTVRLDFENLGRGAFASVMRRIETGEDGEPWIVAPELIVRHSTGAPPRAGS